MKIHIQNEKQKRTNEKEKKPHKKKNPEIETKSKLGTELTSSDRNLTGLHDTFSTYRNLLFIEASPGFPTTKTPKNTLANHTLFKYQPFSPISSSLTKLPFSLSHAVAQNFHICFWMESQNFYLN